MEDSGELERLQELHDAVYEQARVWFQNLKIRFHNQILQHFGPMPEREADIQVRLRHIVPLLPLAESLLHTVDSLRCLLQPYIAHKLPCLTCVCIFELG